MINTFLFAILIYIAVWFTLPELYGKVYAKMIKAYEIEMSNHN